MRHKKNWIRNGMKFYVPILILFFIVVILIVAKFSEPPLPKHFVLATGNIEGAYHAFGQKYTRIFAQEKITVEVRPTAGSIENLKLLDSGQVDIGFVQGGVSQEATISNNLYSLASVYYEPLWVFYRGAENIERLTQFVGKRINIGKAGSGTQAVAKLLLDQNGITEKNSELFQMSFEACAAALEGGTLDVGFFVAAPSASVIHQLLWKQGIRLMNFQRYLAYDRTHYFLRGIVIPQGVFDFEHNIPSEDILLLSTTATLVGRTDLHPQLIEHILKTVGPLHRKAGLLEAEGEFPSPKYVDFPLYEVADRYFHVGPSPLSRYFSYRVVSIINRLKIFMLSVLPLLLVMLKFAPPVYRWGMGKRIYKWYNVLYEVETSLEGESSSQLITEGLAKLENLKNEVGKVSVPANYRKEMYDLRMHIDWVAEELESCETE